MSLSLSVRGVGAGVGLGVGLDGRRVRERALGCEDRILCTLMPLGEGRGGRWM